MDIISSGVANKVAQIEKDTRNNVLGSGIEGAFPHTKERIDAIEATIENVNAQANKLIVNDTINIMKAHAKFNSVAKSMKYKMQNMIFDDLLDLSGIDTVKSSNYTHDSTNGLLLAGTNCMIQTVQEIADTIPSKIVLTVEENIGTGTYSISRDNGIHWELITPNTLFYFTDTKSPLDNKIRIKAELPSGTQLLNYSLTWA